MAIVPTGRSQDCTLYFPSDEGTLLEFTQYDRKDRITGSTIQKVIGKETSGNSLLLTVQNTMYDDKGDTIMDTRMRLECRNGEFYFDMSSFFGDESMAALEDLELSIEGDNLAYPAGMKAGDALEDGQIRIIVGKMPALNTTMTISNRKVEAVEPVTTQAGTFECFRISYDIETKTVMTFHSKGIEWIARDVGTVRSETLNKNGKLNGYTILSRLEK